MLTLDDIAGLSDVQVAIFALAMDKFCDDEPVQDYWNDQFSFMFTQLYNALDEEYIRRSLDFSTWRINTLADVETGQ